MNQDLKISGLDRLIGFAGWALPAAIILIICLYHDPLAIAGDKVSAWIIGIPSWLIIYVIWNGDFIGQQDWKSTERLNHFHSVKTRGFALYCWRGVIDHVVEKGNFRSKKQPIFIDSGAAGGLEQMNFKDDTAGVNGYIQLSIGDPGTDIANRALDVYNYVYAADDAPIDRAVQIAQDHIRPELQKETVDDAQIKRHAIANGQNAIISQDIRPFGLYLWPVQTPILIEDIVLSPESQTLRRQRLLGSTTAAETENEADGVIKAIKKIQGEEGSGCTFDEARGIWERQETRKMLVKTGANVTLLGDNPDSVVRMFDVSGKKGV